MVENSVKGDPEAETNQFNRIEDLSAPEWIGYGG